MSLSPAAEQYKAKADAKIAGWAECARQLLADGRDESDTYAVMCRLMEQLVTPEQAPALLALALMHLAKPPVSLDDLAHLDFEPNR